MRTKKTYKAQALAIIMVILVVSSIIGFSVFSRLMTQKRSALKERESSEALEVADMILSNFLLSEPKDWAEKLALGFQYVEKHAMEYPDGPPKNPVESENTLNSGNTIYGTQGIEDTSPNAITKLTQELGHTLDLQNLNICPLSENNNQYTLQLSKTDENTEYALRPGETFVFPIGGKSFGVGCQINITFPNPPQVGGFTVNNIYVNPDDHTIKPYDYNDTTNYCFSPSGSHCGNSNFTTPPNGWSYFSNRDTLTLPIRFKPSQSYMHERIQLTAVGNQELTFKFSMPDPCTEKIELWQLRSSATCNNTYRAKEVIVPDVGWNFSIFNYVLFNGKGNISSSQ